MKTNDKLLQFQSNGVFCRDHEGEFFSEKFYFRLAGENSDSTLFAVRTFGESKFLPGGTFPMDSMYWVFQLQTSGETTVCANDNTYHLHPGDMLVIPPHIKHTYRVKNEPMRKYFITIHNNALLDILLLGEIEKHGILFRNNSGNDYMEIFSQIREAMHLPRPDEECSVLLYKLIYRIRKEISAHAEKGNFRQKLANAAGKIELMTSLDNLAVEFNMPKHTLIRTFHRELGTSPINYMIQMRLDHARQLLTFSELSIAEVASACGYTSPAFFASEFRKKFGISPREFRKRFFAGNN